MKKTVLLSAMGAIGLVSAQAASAQEVGRVISSTPVVQQVPVSRQVCTQQPVAAVEQPQASSGGGALIGAIAGGLLGHTVGGGGGRAAATGIGAIAGAAVGDSLERRPAYAAAPMQQCSMQTTYENRTTSYNVQYEYAGKTYNVQMPYDPGPTIKLQVTPQASNAPADANVQQAATTVSQPVYVAQTPSYVYPAYAGYPAYAYAPYPYYRPYWAAPVSFSFGYVYHGGHRRWH